MMEDYDYLNPEKENMPDSKEIINSESLKSLSQQQTDDLMMEIDLLKKEIEKQKNTNKQLTLSMNTKVKFELSQRTKISELQTTISSLNQDIQSKESLLATTNTNLSSCKSELKQAKKDIDKKEREVAKLNKQIQQQNDAIQAHKTLVQQLLSEQEKLTENNKNLEQKYNNLMSTSNQLTTQLSTQLSSLENTSHQNQLTFESRVSQLSYTQLIQRKQIEVLYEELTAIDPNQVYIVNTRLSQLIDAFNSSATKPQDMHLFCLTPELSQIIQTHFKPEVLWREYQSNEVVHHTINMGILGAVVFVISLVLCVLFGCRRPAVTKPRISPRVAKKAYTHTSSTVSEPFPVTEVVHTDNQKQDVAVKNVSVQNVAVAPVVTTTTAIASLGSYIDSSETEASVALDARVSNKHIDKCASSVSSGSVTPKYVTSASASGSGAVTPIVGASAGADRPDSRAATPPSHKSTNNAHVDRLSLSPKVYSAAPVFALSRNHDDEALTPVTGKTKHTSSIDDDVPTPIASRIHKTELEDMPTPVMSKVKASGIEDLPTPVVSKSRIPTLREQDLPTPPASKIKPSGLALEDLPTPDTSKIHTARSFYDTDIIHANTATRANDDSGVNTPVVNRQHSKSVIGLHVGFADENENEVTPRLTTAVSTGIREDDLDLLRRSIDEQFRQAGTVASSNSPRTNSFAAPSSSNNKRKDEIRSSEAMKQLDAESQSVTPKLIRSPSRSTKKVGGVVDCANSSGSVTPRVVTAHSRSVSRDRSAVRGHPESESREVTPRVVRSDSKRTSPQVRNAPDGFGESSAEDAGSRSVTPRLIKTHSSSRIITDNNKPTSGSQSNNRGNASSHSESLSRSVTPRVVRNSSRSHTPAAAKVGSHSRGSSGGSVYSQLVEYDYELATSRSVTPRLQKSASAVDRMQSRADSRADSRSETPINSSAYRPQYAQSAVDAIAVPSGSSSRADTPVLTRAGTHSPRASMIENNDDTGDEHLHSTTASTTVVSNNVAVTVSVPVVPSSDTVPQQQQGTSSNTPSAHVKAMISSEQQVKTGKKKKKGKGK